MEKPISKTAPLLKPAPKTNRSIRFKSAPMTLGYLDLEPADAFAPQIVGIILNESYTGCALLLTTDYKFKANQQIKIKVGDLDAIDAQLVWFKTIEENIYKVGVKYLA